MYKFILPFAVISTVAACTAQQLTNLGVSADNAAKIVTVTNDAISGGQLFCTLAGKLFVAGDVKVTGATAASVAQACDALQVAGSTVQATPAPAAPGQTAITAAVAPTAAAAVIASVPAS